MIESEFIVLIRIVCQFSKKRQGEKETQVFSFCYDHIFPIVDSSKDHRRSG